MKLKKKSLHCCHFMFTGNDGQFCNRVFTIPIRQPIFLSNFITFFSFDWYLLFEVHFYTPITRFMSTREREKIINDGVIFEGCVAQFRLAIVIKQSGRKERTRNFTEIFLTFGFALSTNLSPSHTRKLTLACPYCILVCIRILNNISFFFQVKF